LFVGNVEEKKICIFQHLVESIRKRDPRVRENEIRLKKEQQEREEAEKKKRMEREEKLRKERQEQLQLRSQEKAWAHELNLDEFELPPEEEEEETNALYCIACKKSFKSEKQFRIFLLCFFFFFLPIE
jgi:DnaJ family protein A protein 5